MGGEDNIPHPSAASGQLWQGGGNRILDLPPLKRQSHTPQIRITLQKIEDQPCLRLNPISCLFSQNLPIARICRDHKIAEKGDRVGLGPESNKPLQRPFG